MLVIQPPSIFRVPDERIPEVSNGPITTRFEERVNKELARLGNDGDVQAFLARLVRAFVDTIGELEARRELSPTVEALRETIEIIDDIDTNAANDNGDDGALSASYARYVNALDIPNCWIAGVETTQHVLINVADRLGATGGSRHRLRVVITPDLSIYHDDVMIGYITGRIAEAFADLTADGPIETLATLIYARSKDLWCVKLGETS